MNLDEQIETEWEMTLLPEQVSRYSIDPSSPEEVVAWRFLAVLILDCAGGDRRIPPTKRLEYIDEVESWIENDAMGAKFRPGPDGFEWDFSHFCEVINQDESYFRRKLREKITNWRRAAREAERGRAYLEGSGVGCDVPECESVSS